MNIYTYYEDIYDKQFKINDQSRLLDLWMDSWSSKGWTPIVLNSDDAKKNPNYDKYLNRFIKYPSLNHKEYELACFLRWVAMEMIGGYHCDYDVMNYGFIGEGETSLTFYSKFMVPCMVFGTKEDYTRILELFMSYNRRSKKHVSDQTILVENINTIEYNKRYLCPEYKQEGNWFQYELVHYPNGVMSKYGLQPRYMAVEEFNNIINTLK